MRSNTEKYWKSISIIIPAYNEEAGIEKTLRTLCNEPQLSDAEIIVVNDGSTDKTSEIVNLFSRISLICQPRNRGYGHSISLGIKASSGQYVIWFDADGQHRVEDLIKVKNTLIKEQLDYCVGVRDSRSYERYNRIIGKYILKQAVKIAVGQGISDFNSGLRGFRRDVIIKYLDFFPKGFGASTATTLLMIECDHIGKEVPIIVRKRVGQSTVRQFRDGMGSFWIILRMLLLFKPMRFFGFFGGIFIIAGSVYGLKKAIISRMGFPVFASLIIIFGVQSLFFGLLADQISSLRLDNIIRD